MGHEESLLLVTHVPMRKGPRGWQIDDQTAAGIAQWRQHFGRVTFCGVDHGDAGAGSASWVDADGGVEDGTIHIVALPWAYRLGAMARHVKAVRAQLAPLVAQHRHLCFTIGGLVGDWPALAAQEAIGQKRAYAAWIDRVEASVLRNKVADAPFPRRLAAAAMAPAMEAWTRHLLRHSRVALLQGRDTFDHYARHAPDPHCTYDTHTHATDQIDAAALAAKQAHVASGAPLRIVYVGRAAAMKGPSDWIDVLERLDKAGVPFTARWIGDGPDLAAMRSRVAASGLGDRVDLPGFEGRRDVLLAALRDSDMLLFCHRTAESARCLIEALVSGCPIIGYDGGYPRGLVERHGGGLFVPPADSTALADRIAALHADRAAMVALLGAAAQSGTLYTEDALYAHRAELMRRG
ncbi:hypothetical protein SAMIE_1032410 [Sphingobium amiense]|uniref:Glycosyl transferase family 1 domain-containing protein n=1 Tax=Sphingobium amiense TaxID=135719 RepID=A0A494WFE3_9SPHN|nr:glycosyltransferase [Sphingobium amiense]BBD99740.1 hypothetical protein SAMIE_1032410 [Sphingobium amiense]